MPWLGFEPTNPVFEWGKTFHALDLMATVIGWFSEYIEIIPLYSINRSVIVMETQCVFCDLGTRVLYIMYVNFTPINDRFMMAMTQLNIAHCTVGWCSWYYRQNSVSETIMSHWNFTWRQIINVPLWGWRICLPVQRYPCKSATWKSVLARHHSGIWEMLEPTAPLCDSAVSAPQMELGHHSGQTVMNPLVPCGKLLD
jgi:hypothetical protein